MTSNCSMPTAPTIGVGPDVSVPDVKNTCAAPSSVSWRKPGVELLPLHRIGER